MSRASLALMTTPLALALAACAGTPAAEAPVAAVEAPMAEVAFIGTGELAAMRGSGAAIVIDVRTPEEFAAGHLPGAINMPVESFDPSAVPMEEGRETVLYCRSGGRSGRAATMLADYTGDTVRHLEGGITAWLAAGLETTAPPPDGQE